MEWQWSKFHELSVSTLYEVLALRQRVFIVEQKCPYLDADGLDERAWHLLGWQQCGNQRVLSAYVRVFPGGIRFKEPSIGRVVTAPEFRGMGLGKAVMKEAMVRLESLFGRSSIRISAQAYLKKFYQELGFVITSEMYLEDDIPHFEMLAMPQ